MRSTLLVYHLMMRSIPVANLYSLIALSTFYFRPAYFPGNLYKAIENTCTSNYHNLLSLPSNLQTSSSWQKSMDQILIFRLASSGEFYFFGVNCACIHHQRPSNLI